jgi:hypothetical protein
MMLSLNPKRLASIENAPGPTRMIDAANAVRRAATNLDCRPSSGGRIEVHSAAALRPMTAAAIGVKNPAKSKIPVTTATPALIQVAIEGSLFPVNRDPACHRTTKPTAALSSSKPLRTVRPEIREIYAAACIPRYKVSRSN